MKPKLSLLFLWLLTLSTAASAISIPFAEPEPEPFPPRAIFLQEPDLNLCARAVAAAQTLSGQEKADVELLTMFEILNHYFPYSDRLVRSSELPDQDPTFVLWDLIHLNLVFNKATQYASQVQRDFQQDHKAQDQYASAQSDRALKAVIPFWISSPRLVEDYLGGEVSLQRMSYGFTQATKILLRLQLYVEALTTLWSIEEYDDEPVEFLMDEVAEWYEGVIHGSPYEGLFPYDPNDALRDPEFLAHESEYFAGMSFAKARKELTGRPLTPALRGTLERYLSVIEAKGFEKTHPIFEVLLRFSDDYQVQLK
jgi:hypothetical protein